MCCSPSLNSRMKADVEGVVGDAGRGPVVYRTAGEESRFYYNNKREAPNSHRVSFSSRKDNDKSAEGKCGHEHKAQVVHYRKGHAVIC